MIDAEAEFLAGLAKENEEFLAKENAEFLAGLVKENVAFSVYEMSRELLLSGPFRAIGGSIISKHPFVVRVRFIPGNMFGGKELPGIRECAIELTKRISKEILTVKEFSLTVGPLSGDIYFTFMSESERNLQLNQEVFI